MPYAMTCLDETSANEVHTSANEVHTDADDVNASAVNPGRLKAKHANGNDTKCPPGTLAWSPLRASKPFIVWRDEWTLDVAFMDEDHRRLAARLNQIAPDVCRCADGDWTPFVGSRLRSRLDALGVHTREHFRREEQVMRETDYPAFASHKIEHDLLLAEYTVMLRDLRGARVRTLESSTLDALKQWLIAHVLNDDKALAQFLRRDLATPEGKDPTRSSQLAAGWSESLPADGDGGTLVEPARWRR